MAHLDVLALDIDGVLTNGRVGLGSDNTERKEIAFRDLDAVMRARREGFRVALLTGEKDHLVATIAKRLSADQVLSGAKDKLSAVRALAEALEVSTSQICFVGDSDRDALAFGEVGLALAPQDASTLAKNKAHRILEHRGGEGAVAEAVDLLLSLRRADELSKSWEAGLRSVVQQSVEAHQKLLAESIPTLAAISGILISAFRAGNKMLICGNGGSAADAQHVAAELIGRFAIDRAPLPAIALTTDTSILTAVSNDWEFDEVFSRQVRALARSGDVVVGISTSGRSANVVQALQAGRDKGATCIAFTGARGGSLAKHAHLTFSAPDSATPRIQELHILAWHAICELVEAELAERHSWFERALA